MANWPKLTREGVWMIRNISRPHGSHMVERMAKFYNVSLPTVLAALHGRGTYKGVEFTPEDDRIYREKMDDIVYEILQKPLH